MAIITVTKDDQEVVEMFHTRDYDLEKVVARGFLQSEIMIAVGKAIKQETVEKEE